MITSSGVKASAVESYTQWTLQETSDFFGESIPFQYTVNGVTSSSEFLLSSSSLSFQGLNIADNSVISASSFNSYDYLVYTSPALGYYSNADISIPIDLYYSGGFRMFVASITSFSSVESSSNLISSYPDNTFGLQRAPSANASASANLSNYYNLGSLRLDNRGFSFRALTYDDIDNAAAFISFSGITSNAYDRCFYLIVATPYSYGDVSHNSPTTTAPPVTTTAPSGSGDINVNVDMTETNGLLDRILAAIQGIAQSILDGIKGLFIPDDDFMDGFKDNMSDLLENHLGGLYEAEQIMTDAFGRFPEVAAKSEIYIPPVNLTLADTTMKLGDWHVPLKVTGIPAVLYDGIAFIIDFLCLAAFLRMCRNKLEIFLNPDSEVVKE